MNIEIPDDDAIRAAIQPFVELALSAADAVPKILKDHAKFQNEDVDGNQMERKKPRPKEHPKNLPNLQLIETGAMMLGDERWSSERVDKSTVSVVFDPPDYLEYLIEKDPQHGGRKWITPDKINEQARKKIEAEVQRRVADEFTAD